MANGTKNSSPGLKVTGFIVPVAITGTPRPMTPRLPWRLQWRKSACDATFALERAGRGLFCVEGYDRHGMPAKVRINLRHPMALPAGCIFLAALPFLALWAAIVPLLRWHDRRDARLHNTEMLRNRS